MKLSELTMEMFDKMVMDDLVNSCKYSPDQARKLMKENADVVDDGYKGATDEKYFIGTHKKGDTESLNFFRNGNYIKSKVLSVSQALDLLN